jgi:hypothetical protein
MATVDHLNAPYARTPPKTDTSLVHSRNLSNVTLFSTTTHSHPSEPLLHATTPQTVNYDDQPDHSPTDRDEPIGRLPCEAPLVIHDNPMNEAEKQGYWARNRRTLKLWKWLKLGLQAVLCEFSPNLANIRRCRFLSIVVAFLLLCEYGLSRSSLIDFIATWAIYNTVRYFIAFSDFGDPTNQALCLALGTSTGVSFLLIFSSFLLAIRKRLIRGVTPSYLSYVRSTMEYLSSFCLIGPAVVNFALIFIWKGSEDPHWNVVNRCHFDVDVVWSVSNTLCSNKSPYWSIWLTVSALRLALTLIISVGPIAFIKSTIVVNTSPTKIGYHIVSSLNYGSRRQRAVRGFRARISDDLSALERAPSSFNPNRDLVLLQSDSTLCGTSRSEPSPQNQIRLARSHSSGLSQDISLTEPLALDRPFISESENELLPNENMDRFQPMASHIARETDQALDLAHSPSPETMNGIPTRDLPPSYKEDWDDFNDARVGLAHNNIFNLPPIFPALGYNEFGLPYPPDQNVRVLNGYIRRMPTIESMGSGEVGSSIGASSNRATESILNSSRPPTRSTLLSMHSTDHDLPNSEPPSRTNSLSARAELIVGLSSVHNNVSEHGELLGRTSPVARRLSTPISYVDHTLSDYTTSTATSGTSSYQTATSEPSPPGLTRPVLGQPP